MKEICIPFNAVDDKQIAEVLVRIPDTGQEWIYRVETFYNPQNNSPEGKTKVDRLKEFIKTYDPGWELIQILDTMEGSSYVHLLYRKLS